MMRTSNPVLNTKTFSNAPAFGQDAYMTAQGTVNKIAILLLCVFLTASWTWAKMADPAAMAGASGLAMVAALVGFVLAMVISFKPVWSAFLAPVYALCEGAFIGVISAMFERQFPGLVYQAVGLTFGTLGAMVVVYKMGLIRVNDTFRSVLITATAGLALFYLVNFIMGFFGMSLPLIHSASPLGIGFSVIVVGVAALNLLLDFDFIERGSQAGAPKYMEWYGAFALMVTLIWLYIEILRLLSKLRDRR